MVNMTLSIPEELSKKMKSMPEMRWSEIARQAIQQKIEDLEALNKLASKSKITDKDIEEFSKQIKRAASKRFNKNCSRH